MSGFQTGKTLYVGGLAEEVNEKLLMDIFLPFGDIISVQMPMDIDTHKHRGFGFVEFEFQEDSDAAIDNMDNSELFGRVLRVNLANPQVKNQPLWKNPELYSQIIENQTDSLDQPTTTTTSKSTPT